MDLVITNDGGRYTGCVNEKLIAVNSSEFEAALKKIVEDADELVLDHTEDRNLDSRKKLYAEEGSRYYHGNLFIPDDLESIEL